MSAVIGYLMIGCFWWGTLVQALWDERWGITPCTPWVHLWIFLAALFWPAYVVFSLMHEHRKYKARIRESDVDME